MFTLLDPANRRIRSRHRLCGSLQTAELVSAQTTDPCKPPNSVSAQTLLISTNRRIRSRHYLFKRLAYTLTAYCYGSKSVTQPDASSKRYLWDKISYWTYRTQNNSDRYQFENIASDSNCQVDFRNLNSTRTKTISF